MLENKIQEIIQQGLPLKLHLGCGPVIFDGYVNIDGNESSDPNSYVHDVSLAFPIPDNSVDEILTVHVIEHIDRRDIEQTFKEWIRILKPGGIVATEWPDMLKVCKEIVAHPEVLWSTDRAEMKRTMYLLFSNTIRYKDPAMRHVWGYSEESLGKKFLEHGFSSWKAEDNLYRKTTNDSRVVAYK